MASDFVMTSVAFFLFNIYRFKVLSLHGLFSPDSLGTFLCSQKLILEQIFVPAGLLAVYWLSGYYNKPIDKSRLHEFIVTFYSALFNSILIFFLFLINDRSPARFTDYMLVMSLTCMLLVFTYIGRLSITTYTMFSVKRHQMSHKVLIIGNSPISRKIYHNLKNSKSLWRYDIVGFIRMKGEPDISDRLPCWNPDDIENICISKGVTQIILAPCNEKDKVVLDMLDRLYPLGIPVKIAPDTLSYITSSIRMTDILAEPLIDLTAPPTGECSQNIKKAFDILISATALILLAPLMLSIAITVRLSSDGPVFYSQERIGKKRKPFLIYKFRSMYVDAEANGPMLSSDSDHRITPIGHVLRKYRLDELPQFWNVIKGDMSLVGPRPEREFYIRQIIDKAPYYSLIFQVRPGITSWGMVKFGYASTVSQMVERAKFDLIYITNMSIALDIKIMIYTIRTILKGSGL